jgi:hypothetical protein
LKKGRAFAPPRARRITTMIYPLGAEVYFRQVIQYLI